MNDVQVLTFHSGCALYGIMAGQVAHLGDHKGDSDESLVDVMQLLEGPHSVLSQAEQSLVIVSHGGVKYRIPAPVELSVLGAEDFHLVPQVVAGAHASPAVRAVFVAGGSIGLLIDLDRVAEYALEAVDRDAGQDSIHQRMV